MTDKLSILVMEDHPLFMHRLKGIMQAWPRCGKLLTCTTVGEATALIECNDLDLLLADLRLPDGNGVDAVRALRELQPNAQSLVISALAGRDTIVAALRAGAAGYIHKEDSSTDITSAIEQVLAGGAPLSPGIAREILALLGSEVSSLDPAAAPTVGNEPTSAASEEEPYVGHDQDIPLRDTQARVSPLTKREQQVLQAISRGYSNREVATLLGLSEATVPVHVRNIYRKLEVKNRAEAVFEARSLGLIDA